MVQWTEKPAAKAQASSPREAAYRPVRKAKKSALTGVLQAVTVCAVFGLIVGSYFLITGSSTSSSSASRQNAHASDTTGRIVVKDQEHCRELGFDNQSGKMVQKGAVQCHDTPSYNGSTSQSLYRHPTNRLESIRKSFAQ